MLGTSSSKDKGVKEFPVPNERTLLGRYSSIIHSIFDLNHQIKQLYSLSHFSFLKKCFADEDLDYDDDFNR